MDLLKREGRVIVTVLVMFFLFSGCTKKVSTLDTTSPSGTSDSSNSKKVHTKTTVEIDKPYINNESVEVVTEALTMLDPQLTEEEINKEDKAGGSKLPEGVKEIKDIFYEFNSVTLKDNAMETLEKNLPWLMKKDSAMILVEGYADERGTNEYNISLGEKRVGVVKKYLSARGIPQSRIEIVSYGEEKGFCSEHNEECWSQNRRSHFVLGNEQ